MGFVGFCQVEVVFAVKVDGFLVPVNIAFGLGFGLCNRVDKMVVVHYDTGFKSVYSCIA